MTMEKLKLLKDYIRSKGSAVIAFSGGVDSSFLLKVAHDVLGDNVLAVTAQSCTFPEREFAETVSFTDFYGMKHKIISSDELEIPEFVENPPHRCYICKKDLFSKMKMVAKEQNLRHVFEGSNLDDLSDFRPGLKAISELQISSPLKEVGLTKDEIRILSKEMGLNTWDKPSFACLSSRFPYGHKITREKLKMVDAAEQFLIDLGFKQVRVRHHGETARVEMGEEDFQKLLDPQTRKNVYSKFRQLGFLYSTLDLMGYRTGSMNEGL